MKPISSSRSSLSAFSESLESFSPPNRTSPEVTLSIPEAVYSSVDFPEPEGPIIATISPSETVKLTFFSTLF